MINIVAPTPEVLRTNLAQNPHAVNSQYWSSIAGGATVTLTRPQTTATPDARPGFARVTVTAIDPGSGDDAPAQGIQYAQSLAGLAGDTYTFSAYVRTSAANPAWHAMVVETMDAGANTTLETAYETYEVEVTGVWLRVSVTFTATQDFGFFRLKFQETTPQAPAVGATLDMTCVLVEKASALDAYFDGSTEPLGHNTFAWTGAANASMSVVNGPSIASPDLVTDYNYQREARTIVHTTIAGSEPDISLRPIGLRNGTLNMFCKDRATATRVENLHLEPFTLYLDATDDEPTASMYYVATGQISVAYDSQYRTWKVSVAYQEVAP